MAGTEMRFFLYVLISQAIAINFQERKEKYYVNVTAVEGFCVFWM